MSYPPISDKIQEEIIRKVEFNDLYNKEKLYPHQEFVRRYLSPFTPYKGILLFHTLGSGKSLICIAIAVDHYLHDKKQCLIVTKGNSGTENFKKEIDIYYEMSNIGKVIPRPEYNKIFIMVHYMALHNNIKKMNNMDIVTKYSNFIFVFDEIHNVRRLKLSVNREEDEQLGTKIYNSLERLVTLSENTKTLLVTATPMTNDIEQLNSTMQLLTNNHSTSDPSRFNGLVSYNSKIKHRPKKIYHGEYGYLDSMKVYPSYMVSHQRRFHISEQAKGTPKDIYRTLTHISLFCFPDDKKTGLSNLYGRNIFSSGIMEARKYQRTITSMKTELQKTIKYTSYHVKEKYRKWLVGENLRKCSSKYAELIDIVTNPDLNKGPIFIYIEEVRGSGLLLLANVLEAHGFELYTGDHLDTITQKPRYTFCVGDQALVPNKTDRLEGFNHPHNKDGSYINILIGSKVIGESITLKNVRVFHVITIHWNDSTVEQAIGRVIRSGSHDELPAKDRTVDIYVHAAVFGSEQGDDINLEGTDLYKLDICNRKQQKIRRMEELLKEKAIDKYAGTYDKEMDSSTFILYYMEKHQAQFYKILINALTKNHINRRSVDIDTLVNGMKVYDSAIAMEVIYRTVTSNTIIYKDKYLRESNGKLYLVEDPSVPFFFIDPIVKQKSIGYSTEKVKDETTVSIKPTIPLFDKKLFKKFKKTTIIEKVSILREMQFLKRISFIENIIKDDLDDDINSMFGELFINYHKDLYHIMCYRIPGDAYTAVLPIPKANLLQNKIRILDKNTNEWRYLDELDTIDEKSIIQSMEKRHSKTMTRIDKKEDMFMILSLIDNKSRLRTRLFETTTKGNVDRRFIRKGRCLSSILKVDLALLCAYIKLSSSCETNSILDKLDAISDENTFENITSVYDKNIKLYGYESTASLIRENPKMYNLFTNILSTLKTKQVVECIEEIMINMDKYLFL